MRGLNGGINATMNSIAGNGVDLLNNGLNNDWRVRTMSPLGDLKLSGSLDAAELGDATRNDCCLQLQQRIPQV